MLSAATFDSLEGGAVDEHSVRWNTQAYERLVLLPRGLTGRAGVDIRAPCTGHSWGRRSSWHRPPHTRCSAARRRPPPCVVRPPPAHSRP
ncbi:alpha-hydroxy-acid oxidizing protein [Streptomyces sp. TRM72054]|nr:alpha-hydroxy-acid oxidizing protein [Streptomyces sp. TRM72054]